MEIPAHLHFKMPPEWADHSCCWMQWPTDNFPSDVTSSWSNFDVDKGRISWAEVANTISQFEDLKMIVHPDNITSAKKLLSHRVKILNLPINDAWARDSGAIFLLNNEQKLGGVDSDFNCWGYKTDFELDDQVANFMIKSSGAKYFKNNMVLEGGSIHVDGQGTMLTTEQCLLHDNRNPELTKSEIEDNLKKMFGVTNIIWLKHGTDEGTDGHIDNVACFSAPGTVIAMTCNDKHDPYYDRLNENLEVLKTSTDSSGNRLKIIELEMSYKRIIPKDDEPCSYINFYIANNAIVLPIFNDKKADENAKQIIQAEFPNRKLICLDGTQILLGGGGVHCITQQQPRSQNG